MWKIIQKIVSGVRKKVQTQKPGDDMLSLALKIIREQERLLSGQRAIILRYEKLDAERASARIKDAAKPVVRPRLNCEIQYSFEAYDSQVQCGWDRNSIN
jgi:hypothetical protein